MSGGLARRTPTDEWLAEQTGVDLSEKDGRRVISITPAFAQRFNTLTPISQVMQVDPSYSPTPRVVQLVANEDTYKQGYSRQHGDLHALTKQGLTKIAELAQVEHENTELTRIREGDKVVGLQATVTGKQRGPDGQWRTKSETRAMDYDILLEKVELELADKAKRFNDPEPTETDIRRRYVAEREHLPSKLETKAWLRVIRAFLPIKNVYTLQELNKPFFCIGWALTPDYGNPAIGQLTELNRDQASRELYGGEGGSPVIDLDHPESEADNAIVVEEAEVEDEAIIEENMDSEYPEPEDDFTFTSGPYEGRQVSDVVQTSAGLQYLAASTARLDSGEQRDKAVGWLQWAEQREVTDEVLTELAELAGDPS